MRRALYLASSCGLAYVLAGAAAVLAYALTRMPAPSVTDHVMRGYGVVVFAALAGLAFTAAVALTPRPPKRSS